MHQNTVRAGGRLHKRLTVQKPSTATNDDEVIHSKSHDGLTRVSAKRRTGAGRRREADDLTQSWYSMRATAGAAVARYHPQPPPSYPWSPCTWGCFRRPRRCPRLRQSVGSDHECRVSACGAVSVGRRGRAARAGVGFTSIEIVIKMIYKYPKSAIFSTIDGTEDNTWVWYRFNPGSSLTLSNLFCRCEPAVGTTRTVKNGAVSSQKRRCEAGVRSLPPEKGGVSHTSRLLAPRYGPFRI